MRTFEATEVLSVATWLAIAHRNVELLAAALALGAAPNTPYGLNIGCNETESPLEHVVQEGWNEGLAIILRKIAGLAV